MKAFENLLYFIPANSDAHCTRKSVCDPVFDREMKPGERI